MFSSKLILGIDKYTSTFVELEYKSSVPIWKFIMMVELKW